MLLLVVDQLRADRLDPALPGGLGRLAREGRSFLDATLAHAPTDTCAGHAVMLTGRHPGAAGIPGNQYIDRAAGRVRYCVGDADEAARTLGGGPGRSPRALRVTALGDWLKQAQPAARVFSLAGKDRSAIVLGGQRPDGVYWLVASDPPRFTTSGYYRPKAPAWLDRFNGDAEYASPLLERVPERWDYPAGRPGDGLRADDYPHEDPSFGRARPHPVRARDAEGTPGFLATPFADELTLDLARLIAHQERLGSDATPDLLAVSLSASDWIGHRYGPESREVHAARARLDAALGELLKGLEQQVGAGRLLVVLTSDHGVLPIPEWLAETGRSECPVPGGRVDARALAARLESELSARFGAPPDGERWLLQAGFQVAVNPRAAAKRKVDPPEVVAWLRSALEREPGVAHVFTREALLAGEGPAPFAALYRRALDPERSGDLLVQPARDCLLSLYPHGTDHGSPYLYDRAVPLIFFGAGVEPGRVRGPAGPVDIAPTLARELGLEPPAELDGRALPLRSAPAAPGPEGGSERPGPRARGENP